MWRRRIRISIAGVAVLAVVFAALVVVATPAGATVVNDEASLRTAFADVNETTIVLGADISLTDCGTGAVNRNSGVDLQLDGSGHSITQTCVDKQALLQTGAGAVALRNLTISGGSIGIQSQGPVAIDASVITAQTSPTGAFGAQVANTLTVTGSRITNQTETAATQGGTGIGAAGLEAGEVTMTNSTVSGQSGSDSVFGVLGPSNVTVSNSTLSGQSETGTFSAEAIRGGTVAITGSMVTDVNESGGGVATGVFADSAVLSSTTVTAMHGSSAQGVVGTNVTTNGVVVSDVRGQSPIGAGVGIGGGGGGVITVTDTLVRGVSGTAGAFGVEGVAGTVVLNRSTVTGVTSAQTATSVRADPTLRMTNSTITDGGGISVSTFVGSADAVIAYSDIVGNRGVPAEIVGPALTIFGSVVSNTSGSPNCSVNTVISAGYNFADDTSCGLTATGDTQANGANPQLGPLTDNGGRTPTLLPASTSPLLEKIPIAACRTAPATGITSDQRLFPRPRGVACDIGSVEVQLPPPPPLVIEPNFTG